MPSALCISIAVILIKCIKMTQAMMHDTQSITWQNKPDGDPLLFNWSLGYSLTDEGIAYLFLQ